jgi:UDP-glucuronate decarboxylase
MNIITQDINTIVHDLRRFKKKIKNKKFLITGGAGFLGSWFCDVVIAMNGKVVCVDNLSSGSKKNVKHLLDNQNFEFIKADVCEFQTKKKFDYIIHMASLAAVDVYQKNPIRTLDANLVGTKNMLEIARRQKIKSFLFTSTSEVYGDAKIIPTPETYWGNVNPYGPRSMYDEAKRAAEAYCYAYRRKYKVPIRIARIFNTYGPRLDVKSTSQYGRVVVKFIWQALNNRPLTVYGDGKQTRSFCYITDQIIGLFKLLLTPKIDGEVVNIGNDKEIRIIDLAKLVIKLINSKSKITFKPLPPDDPKRRCPDLRKAKKLLHFKPKVGLEEGLKRMIKWCQTK